MSPIRRSLGSEGERGQVAILTALLLTVLLFAIALDIDAGTLFSARRTAQTAADSGAWGGAVVLYKGGSQAQAVAAAQADAALHGFSSGVTVNAPPSSGLFAGNSSYVEVIIDFQVPTALLPAMSGGFTSLSVRGVAGAAPAGSAYAVMALDQGNTPQALYVQPPGTLNVSGGGIMVNSSSPSAAQNNGTVNLTPSSQYIDVNGGTSGIFPPSQLRTSRPVAPDPFANYPKPSTSGLTNWGVPVCCTLQPGIYTGAVTGTSGTWTLNPGIYIFEGGGFTLTGSARITGSGVFLFLTTSTYPSSGGTCGEFNLATTGSSSLTPMTSGTYKNMLLFQDAACPSQLIVTGDGTVATTGTFYLPSAVCELDSPFSASQLICSKIVVEGHVSTISYSTSTAARPFVPVLSE